MKKILNQLFEFKNLTQAQAKDVMLQIGKANYNEVEIAAFTTVFLMRTISIDELMGFKEALLEMALPINLQAEAIDIVGTGGDGKNTFNISTLASFIVAGTGEKVAKHGNYASTAVTGSSDVLQSLGLHFTNDVSVLQKQIDEANICFLHAPLFHPALKTVANMRKQLGIRTLFNLMGPLVNPVKTSSILLGVYNAEIGRLYNYVMQQEAKNFCIVNSLDGYDEISLTTDTKVITQHGEKIYTALELGKRMVMPTDILGGATPEEAGKIFIKILQGQGTWAQNAVVLANAAMALQATGKFNNYDSCYNMAVESLEAGKALQSFKKLINT
jgi:anthranilate phosphoribosyltransferase